MAKFRYRMQSILEIKKKLEEQAKNEFAAARAALNEEEDKLRTVERNVKRLMKTRGALYGKIA